MKRVICFIIIIVFSLALPVVAQMRFGFVPDRNSLVRSEEEARLFCTYLEDRLDDRITVRLVKSEDALYAGLQSGRIDLAVLDNLSYRGHSGNLNLLANFTRSAKTTHKLLLIVSTNGSVRSLRELEKGGSSLALDQKSGSRMSFLTETLKGDPGKIFRSISVSPQVVDALSGLLNGAYDAACVEDGLLEAVKHFDPGLVSHVKVLKLSTPYASDPVAARKGLPSALLGRLKEVLAQMDEDSDGQQILMALKITRFVSPMAGLSLYPRYVDPALYHKPPSVRKTEAPPAEKAAPVPATPESVEAADRTQGSESASLSPSPVREEAETAASAPSAPVPEGALSKAPAPLPRRIQETPSRSAEETAPREEVTERNIPTRSGETGSVREDSQKVYYRLLSFGGVVLISILLVAVLFFVLRKKGRKASALPEAPSVAPDTGKGADAGIPIASEAKPERPAEPSAKGRFGAPGKTPLVELRGELKTIRVPDLLQLMASCKNTGTLLIQSKHDEKSLYFKDGKVCSASCLDKDNKNKLGSLLIKLGKITERERARALAVCAEDRSKRLGKALIEIGAVGTEDLREALRVQAEEIVYSIFVFPEGRFEFVKEQPKIDPDEDISLDVMNLLMEGARREDEWQNMRETIPSMEIILDVTEEGRARLDGGALSQDQNLTLSLVNGLRSVREICVRSTMVDFDVCEFLYRLIKLSVLKKVDPTKVSSGKAKVPDAENR